MNGARLRPRGEDVGPATRAVECAAIAGASGLLSLHLARLHAIRHLLGGWSLAVVAAAAVSADLVSGIVHWAADTWGRESLPLIGRRFLRPFRVHHANPQDFLRRDFLDCNGDVAMLTIPLLIGALWIPLASAGGRAAASFVIAFAAVALPTNQVHQWAHRRHPPRPVRWLQGHGLILGYEQHRRHHTAPHTANYCIATGWCNWTLTAGGFFEKAERLVSRVTGVAPRADDSAFARRVAPLPPVTGPSR
jgi:ubiquitin-conjugating enzyme E2 variant